MLVGDSEEEALDVEVELESSELEHPVPSSSTAAGAATHALNRRVSPEDGGAVVSFIVDLHPVAVGESLRRLTVGTFRMSYHCADRQHRTWNRCAFSAITTEAVR